MTAMRVTMILSWDVHERQATAAGFHSRECNTRAVRKPAREGRFLHGRVAEHRIRTDLRRRRAFNGITFVSKESPMTREPAPAAERAESLLAAARSLGPLIEEHAREAELLRRLPDPVVEEFRKAGFFWMKTPVDLGGSELDPVSFGDVMEEIAYHDASAAWATMIGSGTIGTMAGWLPDEGIAELFAPDAPLPTVAGQFTPRGKAVPVEGGYRVTGRWAFGSGIDHSNWVVGGCIVEGTGAPIFVTAPTSEVTVHGNWHAAALQGTGSHDLSFADVFSPPSPAMDASGRVPPRGGAPPPPPPHIFLPN